MYGKQAEVQNPNSCNSPVAKASRCGCGILGINDMWSSHEILIKQIAERAFKSYTLLCQK
jgi:hypothetical protein